MAASDSAFRTVLGVYVTPQTLEAVLLRSSAAGPKLLHRMLRPRLRAGEAVKPDDYSGVLPGMKSSEEVDFTLEVGEDRSDIDMNDPVLQSVQSGRTPEEGPTSFAAQLRDLLAESRALGFGTPDLAFCVGAPEVDYVELSLAPGTLEKGGGSAGSLWERARGVAAGLSAEKRALLKALRAEYSGSADPKRVAFVPMRRAEDEDRYLAIVPTSRESVSPTLRTLAATDEALDRAARRLDAEVSLLMETVTAGVPAEPDQNTAVVRVGANDTLLLFLTGTELRHVEYLRSLTSFDPAETICSRVLLHQDEHRIDQIDHVVLMGGPRDGRLVEGVETFYEDASIYTFTDLLRPDVSIAPDVESTLTPDSGMAVAAALRLLDGASTNLLGAAARPRRQASMFAWHTLLVLVLLCAVSLFFGWRYMDRQQQIAEAQQRLALSPVAMPDMTPEMLKHRVDSLNAVYAKHSRALYVLDSLLVGSDEWSRAIERTARQTQQIEGLWFDNWSVEAAAIKIQGHALDRGNLAALARRLEGTIHELKFTDIQGARAYPFTITVPRRLEMPEVTVRLREEALSPSDFPMQEVSLP